eukprot:m.188504 g.188504  ORF g.188504 m.188504 type:complete len:175 (+) comp18188_c1_seq1:1214-1738(+)
MLALRGAIAAAGRTAASRTGLYAQTQTAARSAGGRVLLSRGQHDSAEVRGFRCSGFSSTPQQLLQQDDPFSQCVGPMLWHVSALPAPPDAAIGELVLHLGPTAEPVPQLTEGTVSDVGLDDSTGLHQDEQQLQPPAAEPVVLSSVIKKRRKKMNKHKYKKWLKKTKFLRRALGK